MSNALTDSPEKTMFTKNDIVGFLQENPTFLADNPDVAELLIPEKKRAVRGKPADFQAYMIERLRNDKEEIKQTAQELIDNSRANMNNQQRIQDAVLRMLEAQTFGDFIHCLTMDLSTMLGVDVTSFIVEAEDSPTSIPNNGIRVVPEGTIDSWMADNPVMLENNIGGIDAIYGGAASLVKSQILLRIDIDPETPPALIAFGSRDADMFAEGQATDQILFLARVIERAFRAWLRTPV